MPYKDRKKYNEAAARSMRRRRLYEAAVRAGDPLALAAEEARRLGETASELRAEKRALDAKLLPLPKPERQPFRAEYEALVARLEKASAAQRDYPALRREAMDAAELRSL